MCQSVIINGIEIDTIKDLNKFRRVILGLNEVNIKHDENDCLCPYSNYLMETLKLATIHYYNNFEDIEIRQG